MQMDILIKQALEFLGTPYLWGGKHPSQGGLDCSGFTHILGRSVGLFLPGAMTAQAQYDWLVNASGSKIATLKPGSFLFYGKSVKEISHVAFALDTYRIIESGGGDSTFTKIDGNQQASKNAGVRIRLISARKDIVAQIYPNYASIGLI
jgi:cell wall-associated NlpC family hydrolase